MFAQALVLFLLSGFWFLTTVNSAPHEFSPLETGLIFSLVGGVLSVQAFVLFLAARVKTSANRRGTGDKPPQIANLRGGG